MTKIIGIFGCRNKQLQCFCHNFVTLEGFDKGPCPIGIVATFIMAQEHVTDYQESFVELTENLSVKWKFKLIQSGRLS